MKTKVITTYLPQYHRVPENDEWWGEGFTEWTNVKKAKPLFEGHIQPKVPLDNNYYDLMNKETIEWQTDLMHKYGIYGMCYFHYWFCGRMILEKPAENLLKWKDINQPFLFFWANDTWARTWSAVSNGGTNWVDNDLKKTSGSGILLEQTYGDEEDWTNHYNYLKQFFDDERYIKKDGAPVLLIYRLGLIECAKEMFKLWNELAIKDGFPGIHLVSVNELPSENPYIKAIAQYGQYTRYNGMLWRVLVGKIRGVLKKQVANRAIILDYKKVWEGMMHKRYNTDLPVYPGGFVKYDETPRRGKNACYIKNATPSLFAECFEKQLSRANKRKCDFMFLDAWNEWGEGNYLEPDIEDGYKYLEAVKMVIDKV